MVRPFFDQTEGHALAVLDTLASGRRLGMRPLQTDLEPSEELMRIGAERLAIHCHRFLLPDGRRERTVLRNTTRTTGRLWDPATNEGFRLRFTAASPALWLAVTRHHLKRGTAAQLAGSRQVPVDGTECGDWMFYALAAQHIHDISGDVPETSNIMRRMRSASPLVVLTSLHPQVDHAGGVERHLDRLLRPNVVRIVECLDGALVRRWTEVTRAASELAESSEDLTDRFHRIALTLGAWLTALDQRGRLDLARAAMSFSAALATDVLRDPEALRQLLVHRLRPQTMRERSAALSACADVAAIGLRLVEHRSRFAAIRYGEERWEEGQLYMAAYDEIVAPYAEPIRRLEYQLRGTIG